MKINLFEILEADLFYIQRIHLLISHKDKPSENIFVEKEKITPDFNIEVNDVPISDIEIRVLIVREGNNLLKSYWLPGAKDIVKPFVIQNPSQTDKLINNPSNKIKKISDKIKYPFQRLGLILSRRSQEKLSDECIGSPKKLVKNNRLSNYPNNELGKKAVLKKLKNKFDDALKLSTSNSSDKNLIYYTISGNEEWLDLLKISLNSLTKQKYINFDVLLITTEEFKNKIINYDEFKFLNIKFFIVKDPIDGVAASLNKLLIYKYPEIIKYKKVLFLDCDTVVIRDLSIVFDLDLDSTKLYTAWSSAYIKSSGYTAFRLPYHGITPKSDDDIKILEENNQRPFNAGQFLFCVSLQMIKHFENVYWLSQQWPGEYFFEQAFMTHYFCENNLTICDVLDNHVNLYSIAGNTLSSDKDINDPNVVIYHFIGNSLQANLKIEFINNFLKDADFQNS